MKLLYISSYHCHLERMELELFHELGIDFLSTGKFLDPRNPRMESLADPLDIDMNGELAHRFRLLNPMQRKWGTPRLNKSFVNKFDMVYVAHCGPNANYLRSVWKEICHKPIMYRTYGLQSPEQELFLQQCKRQGQIYLIRFSEKESIIPNFAGIDASIFPFVDETKYNNWNGNDKKVFTAQNWYRSRYALDNYNLFEQIVNPFPHKICGLEAPHGVLSPDDQKAEFRNSRVYFSLGSRPSPITINAFEALMTGMPFVSWGHKYGSKPGLDMYQIPELVTNYKNGLCSDDPRELQEFIRKCIINDDFANQLSTNARQLAINTFSKPVIKAKWEKFLKDGRFI